MKSKCFIRWRDTNQIELTTMETLGYDGLSDPKVVFNNVLPILWTKSKIICYVVYITLIYYTTGFV